MAKVNKDRWFSYVLIVAFVTATVAIGCKQHAKPGQETGDSFDEGTINISVDESFKPVIEQQVKVYEASHPKAHIITNYKSEADCFRDLQQDSTRMIIVAKGLTEAEGAAYKTALTYTPDWEILAYDAVDVIVNAASPDSVFTIQRLEDLLSGKDTSKNVIMDGKNATSTVRYLLDSVLRGKPFGKNVMAAAGSKAVVEYIARNANSVGFVGSSWVGNDEDPEQVAWGKKVRIALVECKSCKKANDPAVYYAKPAQASIAYGQYPLVRPLYYILKENYAGLGRGFKNFMSFERGQLIFRRSYLVPAQMSFNVRTGNIK
jgi:phosphate transport system substrate-binding protein